MLHARKAAQAIDTALFAALMATVLLKILSMLSSPTTTTIFKRPPTNLTIFAS